MLESLYNLATWSNLKPLVIALMTVAIKLAVSPDVAKTLVRRIVVAVCVAYLAIDFISTYFETEAYQSIALVAVAFFADDIVIVAMRLGSDFRAGAPKFIRDRLRKTLEKDE